MMEVNFAILTKYFLRNLIAIIRKNSIAAAVSLILLCGLSLSIGILSTKAAVIKTEPRVKHVISIEIEKGDTLWSIASEYRTSEYKNLNEYIQEIKDTNGLSSDTIHDGSFLIIPYYSNGN